MESSPPAEPVVLTACDPPGARRPPSRAAAAACYSAVRAAACSWSTPTSSGTVSLYASFEVVNAVAAVMANALVIVCICFGFL